MQRPYPTPSSARRSYRPDQSAMTAAYLAALKRRVDDHPTGEITLPTGRADAGEVAKVLCALELARQAGGR